MSDKPHVVIIGAGFGGLETAKKLRSAPVRVTIIDRTNHHLFQPLLYQVAMAAISSVEIAYPIRSVFREQENITVLMDEVKSIDLKSQAVTLSNSEIRYDYLVIAAGSQSSYFGHIEWAQHAIGLKNLHDAFLIRRQILMAFETAEKLAPTQSVSDLLTFVIIGGGPTGVELAGSLAELSKRVLSKDFRNIKPDSARIVLLEGGPRLLLAFPENVSKMALSKLQSMGVEIHTGTMVTDITASGVQIGDKFIPAVTKLWCAGVSPNPLTKQLADVQLDRGGRLIVQPDLLIPGYKNVFAVGDIACFEQDGKPLPGLAPVAMQQGQSVGENITNLVEGRPVRTFRYIDRGTLATIGRSSAVGSVGKLTFGGLFAWLAWLFIHILNLIGFRNRMVVMFDWFWSYVTFQRGARLISDRGLENQLIDVDRYLMDASPPEAQTEHHH